MQYLFLYKFNIGNTIFFQRTMYFTKRKTAGTLFPNTYDPKVKANCTILLRKYNGDGNGRTCVCVRMFGCRGLVVDVMFLHICVQVHVYSIVFCIIKTFVLYCVLSIGYLLTQFARFGRSDWAYRADGSYGPVGQKGINGSDRTSGAGGTTG